MKNLTLFLFLAFAPLVSFGQHEHHQAKNDTTVKAKSPRTAAMAMVGGNHVHIEYGAPSVRGRNIWNGLVAYNQVWATGAHKATWIEFSNDVSINGTMLPKGKYGIFTIPSKSEWTLIISKDWDMHLADDYNEANDLIRLKVKPKKSKDLVEELQYQVTETGKDQGRIEISWEYLSVGFDFKNSGK
ncbi:DUF2911 domain-containing protein [Rhodonellum sp.]|uniref:DUF2911 domain-containing protein n=1 Tax=Rhodonellum sp. TaxID=2231180 RepID=UPI002722B1AC|nr:DUF2911 domain-containing protein [Rhodonellum sp.]MDO9552220.1 DUF2911 domain-containing protein [Rhodonellum sp.]